MAIQYRIHLTQAGGLVLTDSFGSTVRPGIRELLSRLRPDGHTLILWTNSKRQRARDIRRLHDLERYFARYLFREDYDPDERGVHKDIRQVNGDLIVDDDPGKVSYARSVGRRGFLVPSFKGGTAREVAMFRDLYAETKKRARRGGLFGRKVRK